MATTLLFPGGMQGTLDYLLSAPGEERIIGASSVANDPAMPSYKEWIHLPFITDASFNQRFADAVRDHAITRVITTHPVISVYLKQLVEAKPLGVEVVSASYDDSNHKPHRELMNRVDCGYEQRLIIEEGGQPFPDRLQMATLVKHALRIEGQSDEAKIWAMTETLRLVPKGDVVEIGSYQGRSAFVLGHLTKYYDIGHFLAIDPWKVENNIQHESPDAVNEGSKMIDFDLIFEVFRTNLLPYNAGHINYLRMASDDAFKLYAKPHFTVESEFGGTAYTGRIACLHIDGNHDYVRAASDLAYWAPRVVPGGWIIMDDYFWCFGTGPQRATDEYMEANKHRIDRAFAVGSALFIRIAS